MHVIRLRRPWLRTTGNDEAAATRVDVPESTSPTDSLPGSVVHFERNFNLPTGLQPSSRVYLCLGGWQGRLDMVALNDLPLGVRIDQSRIDITEILQRHNRLRITLASLPDEPARLSGEVTLAIETGQ